MTIDQLDPRPYYEQLAGILRDQIRSGELPPRSQLPSESNLEKTYGLARGTVRRAVRILAEEGFVIVIQGRGAFVVAKPPRS